MSETWFVVCDAATGQSVSVGTVVADPLPAGLQSVALSSADAAALASGAGRWHEGSRSVVADESPVPASVTARQIRLWLVTHGVSLASVDAAIDSIPDAMTRDSVRVEWEYAPYVERSHALLIPLAAALGLTEGQVDAAFREAAAL